MLACGTVAADAEDSRYRVEILVLEHIGHDGLPLETPTLEDFSDALDFLTPPPEAEAAVPDRAGAGLDGTADAEAPEEDSVCAVVHVTEMGPEMEEAWRRLRLSRPFRPLQYLAWEQPGTPPFPALRVHDLESVLTEDPWRDLREGRDAEILQGEAGGSGPGQQPVPGDTGAGTGEPGDGPLPSPIEYFRLDGRAQLVRTRFLHFEVAVEVREPVFDPSLAEPQPPAADIPATLQDVQPQPTSFLVHRLDQRRQVKTGRMEYFDGPVLGVLAFITDISDTVEADPSISP